jgi:hypothetical protein
MGHDERQRQIAQIIANLRAPLPQSHGLVEAIYSRMADALHMLLVIGSEQTADKKNQEDPL